MEIWTPQNTLENIEVKMSMRCASLKNVLGLLRLRLRLGLGLGLVGLRGLGLCAPLKKEERGGK